MLVFSKQNFVFLAVPKTGTTAIEMALHPKADIVFAKHHKHTTGMRYRTKIKPFLTDSYGMKPIQSGAQRAEVSTNLFWR
tara:strand:+ start:231 stop:470 length:240 start_codon:yes stop_codon:yes gene_type:complete